MGLLVVAGLRNTVATDSCLHGYAEIMNLLYHHGDLVGRGGKTEQGGCWCWTPLAFSGWGLKAKAGGKDSLLQPALPWRWQAVLQV